MLSVQDIHDYLGKYTTIPESWRSKPLTLYRALTLSQTASE
jgi:hypothetical protein